MIIPFGWWHDKHPLKNIQDPTKWGFEEPKCQAHIPNAAVADLFEWEETVAYDEAQYVGRIERGEVGGVQKETLSKPHWQYMEHLEEKKATMLGPRRTFDHAINLTSGARFIQCQPTR